MEIKGQGTLQSLDISRKEMTQGQNRLGIGSEEMPQLLSFCFSVHYQYPLNHRKSKRIPEKCLYLFLDYTKAFEYLDNNKRWKILQEMGILDHLTCLLRNLYTGQKATIWNHRLVPNWERSTLSIQYVHVCVLSPCLFNFYAEHIM